MKFETIEEFIARKKKTDPNFKIRKVDFSNAYESKDPMRGPFVDYTAKSKRKKKNKQIARIEAETRT
jgi:hypothetical protein